MRTQGSDAPEKWDEWIVVECPCHMDSLSIRLMFPDGCYLNKNTR